MFVITHVVLHIGANAKRAECPRDNFLTHSKGYTRLFSGAVIQHNKKKKKNNLKTVLTINGRAK